jgi:hypothetical protein
LHKERPSFNCFPKVIIIEALESEKEDGTSEIEANTNNNTNQMSSRGGEASGAAAPGRGRDSAARLRGSGFRGARAGVPPEPRLRSIRGGGGRRLSCAAARPALAGREASALFLPDFSERKILAHGGFVL